MMAEPIEPVWQQMKMDVTKGGDASEKWGKEKKAPAQHTEHRTEKPRRRQCGGERRLFFYIPVVRLYSSKAVFIRMARVM